MDDQGGPTGCREDRLKEYSTFYQRINLAPLVVAWAESRSRGDSMIFNRSYLVVVQSLRTVLRSSRHPALKERAL